MSRQQLVEWRSQMTENEIATRIVDAAYKVHVKLGPGLLESVYLVERVKVIVSADAC